MNYQILVSATSGAGASPSIAGGNSGRADSITRAMSTADAFACLATSISADAARRAHALHLKADPEVLHKLRVALRRLRSLQLGKLPVRLLPFGIVCHVAILFG